jgi:preprotein translocase subunit YajC
MQFFNPQTLLWLWVILPLAIFLFIVKKVKDKRIAAFIQTSLIRKLPSDHSGFKEILRILIWILFFFFSIITLARPQWGEEKKKIQRKGIDIV